MTLSATLGYGISISRANIVKAGFISLNTLADAIADELPFMSRISNGNIKEGEETLIMVSADTIVVSHDFAHSAPALPEVNASQRHMIDAFVQKNLPGQEIGWTLSAFAS